MIEKTIASETQHWYRRDGSPCYEVEAKNGSMRPATLADARKLDLVPSVTLILRCAAAPGLEAWKARQILEAALTLPRAANESLDDYALRVIEDSRAQGKKAAEKGTELHAAIENYIRGQVNFIWQQHLDKLRNTLAQYGIDLFRGKPEHSFASPLGYGGKIDWHNDEIVIDFKTKESVADKKQLAWPEHCWQLAAYTTGLFGMMNPMRRLINVFVGIKDCEVQIHEWNDEDAELAWSAFACLLRFWKITKKFLHNGAKQ